MHMPTCGGICGLRWVRWSQARGISSNLKPSHETSVFRSILEYCMVEIAEFRF